MAQPTTHKYTAVHPASTEPLSSSCTLRSISVHSNDNNDDHGRPTTAVAQVDAGHSADTNEPADRAADLCLSRSTTVACTDDSKDLPTVNRDKGDLFDGFEPLTGAKLYIIVAGVMVTMLPATLDETIVATSMDTIAGQFGSQDSVAWIANGYLLTMTAFSPLYGKLSDIFGLRLTFLVSTLVFLVVSVLQAVSPSMAFLIAFRTVAGIAAAGLISLAFIAISQLSPEEERGKFLGYLGALYVVSGVLGPVVGGILTDRASWRWNFYINVPLCLIGLVIIWFLLKTPSPQGSIRSKLRRIDYGGAAAFLVSIVAFLLAIQWGGKDYAWNSALIVCLLVASVVFAVVFVWYELRVAAEPFIDLRLMALRNVLSAVIVGFAVGWVLLFIVYYVPLYFQVLRGYSATGAGVQLLAFLVPLNVVAIASGFITERFGCYKLIVIIGMVFCSVGCGLFYLVGADTTRVIMAVILVLNGIGVGLAVQMSVIPAQQQAPFSMIAQVTAFINFTRLLGGVIGISIGSSIINNVLTSKTTQQGLHYTTEEILSVLSSSGTSHVEVDDATRAVFVESYASAIRLALFISFVPSVLGLIVAFGYKAVKPIPIVEDQKEKADSVVAQA
ncbi:hypothetical protein IWQ60_004359 [Tieghemiomyces parasiticus]|uniref:Major facilitator superfamily (MFS) profile domain-containing protein n=1 Tax=Tieghemiomyces parasiticus TaxID=78921 RepID=A0A9W8AEF3_9FUNG|nr:hypothetical protein IWQ60_004359 [Tieghemiomyces parasiticus]